MSSRHTPLTRVLLALFATLVIAAFAPASAPAAPAGPTSGSLAAARLLSPPNTVVGNYAVSASDSRAVFLAAPATNLLYELYSTPVVGGTPLKLNAPLAEASGISVLSVSPLGGRAFYIGQHAADSSTSLYSVPTVGGSPVTLASAQALGAGFDPFTLTPTPDGSRVLFRVQTSQFGPLPLYRVAATGGTPEKIDDNVRSFAITPDSRYVIYVVETAPNQLKSAPLDGSAPPVSLRAIVENSTYAISADSAQVVYSAAGPFGEPVGLFSQPVAGGDQTTLYSIAMGDPVVDRIAITPDSARVVYTTRGFNGSGQTVIDLRSVTLTGGPSVPLGQATGPAGGTASIAFYLSSGERVVYVPTVFASLSPSAATSELRSVPITGGASAQLLPPGATALGFVALNTDGSALAIVSAAGVYVGQTDGSAALVQVSTTTPNSNNPQITANGRASFVDAGVLRLVSLDGQTNEILALPTGVAVADYKLFNQTALVLGREKDLDALYAVDFPVVTPPEPRPNKLHLPLLRK